jgi:GNAT superfamily N-acetyltransferase
MEKCSIELMGDYAELSDFCSGWKSMDDFIHEKLKDCDESHYSRTFCVREAKNNKIIAIFSLAFDSVDIDSEDFDDMRTGAAGTDMPEVSSDFREKFEQKYTYPALEIAYLAVEKQHQRLRLGSALIEEIAAKAKEQKLAGCVFLTVKAWCTAEYSAVTFYEKNGFAKLTATPHNDVWPMYKTLWC